MTTIVFIVAFLLVFSKFFDCYTTSKQITSINQEKNPFTRKMMKKFGVQTTIWTILGLVLIIVIFCILSILIFNNGFFYKLAFIILGSIISVIQFSVALTNKTKRLNIITEILMRLYR